MAKFNCPSCGAENSFKSPASVYTVCPYCKSSLFRSEEQILNMGIVSEVIEDSSPLQLRSSGRFKGKSFSVIGRVRMKWAEGFWNEWCLYLNDGTYAWLAEAQGSFLYTTEINTPVIPRQRWKINTLVTIKEQNFLISDIKDAEIFMAEGELPFRAHQGERRYSADLLPSVGQTFGSLEYDQAYPEVMRAYLGEVVNLKKLEMTYLRSFEGWS